MSDSLWPHGLAAHKASLSFTISRSLLNSCPLSWWCHPTTSSSVVSFLSCLQSFPASGSFLMNQLFTSGGQSTGVSATASVLPMNIQNWSPLELTGLISLQSKGLSRVFSNTTIQKHQFFSAQPSLPPNFSSVAQSSLTVYDNPMDCSIPGLPVHQQLLEFTQTHVHWVGDAIQLSYPLLAPSSAFNLSQHQSLFQWVSSLHQVAKLLEFQLQHQSFRWTLRTDFGAPKKLCHCFHWFPNLFAMKWWNQMPWS